MPQGTACHACMHMRPGARLHTCMHACMHVQDPSAAPSTGKHNPGGAAVRDMLRTLCFTAGGWAGRREGVAAGHPAEWEHAGVGAGHHHQADDAHRLAGVRARACAARSGTHGSCGGFHAKPLKGQGQVAGNQEAMLTIMERAASVVGGRSQCRAATHCCCQQDALLQRAQDAGAGAQQWLAVQMSTVLHVRETESVVCTPVHGPSHPGRGVTDFQS